MHTMFKHFVSLVSSNSHEKHQNLRNFLLFSGVIEGD